MLIDCPAGIGEGLDFATAGAHRALIVANPDFASVRDADRVAGILHERGIDDLRLVINKVRTRLIHKKQAPDIDAVIDATKVRLIGIIPERDTVIAAANRGVPIVLHKRDKAAKALCNIASRVAGKQAPLMRFR